MNERLKELLLGYAHCEPEAVTRLTAAGSNRVYYRFAFADGHTVVGVEGTNPDENRAFLTWLHTLWTEGLIDHDGFSTTDNLRQITDEKKAKKIYNIPQ